MAMWFTVTLAVFRYIFVCHHGIGYCLCNLQRALLTIKIIVIANVIVCIPHIFLYRVVKLTDFGYNFSDYRVSDSYLVEKHKFYKTFNYWFFAVIIKVVPCILLTLLSTMVILAMYQASKRRVRLLQHARPLDHNVNRKYNRTTWMLVSVVLFTVIIELPHGILLMRTLLGIKFISGIVCAVIYS
ncbi:uncharacterized protein LOC127845999 [Dreissena polymorpha]|uniref:uncharacterized protein LOC127845999 n=1 Tax=Dreissena polymorpha TaxID=45954 RepID=UPI0022649F12|nr:uncharacterized protein LOC127845999 [Dreissena polymorpha]